MNIADVDATMSTYMGSRYVNDFTRYGRNFRVVAQADLRQKGFGSTQERKLQAGRRRGR